MPPVPADPVVLPPLRVPLLVAFLCNTDAKRSFILPTISYFLKKLKNVITLQHFSRMEKKPDFKKQAQHNFCQSYCWQSLSDFNFIQLYKPNQNLLLGCHI